jgi:hypothetical protein
MISSVPNNHHDESGGDDNLVPPIVYVSAEEGRQMFDEAARELVGMSGEEFIRRWEAGEFESIPDDLEHRNYIELALMIPLARQES